MPVWLTALLLLSVLIGLMSLAWFRSSQSSQHSDGQSAEGSSPAQAAKNAEKLRGYHELAKDALERAHRKHAVGATAEAAKLYSMAQQVMGEGLEVQVASAGLGPAFSNTARWRSDLSSWHSQAATRLQQLESGAGKPPAASIPSSAAAEGWTALRKKTSAPQPQQTAVASRRAVPARQPPQRTAPSANGAAALTKDEARLQEVVLGEVLQSSSSVRWDDVAGLASAKQALQEMVILPALRADLFRGLRAPARGLLLYGPPGNGKTLLAKALASEAKATFFNISASSLTSRWHGEGEKLVRTLFKVAQRMQPAIIFIDEIDSILSERASGEHEASRRLKTEFLLQFDGVSSDQRTDQIVVVGATNRPWELDDAMRRRLQKRIYVPLPDADARRGLLLHLLQGQPSRLTHADVERVVNSTEGYSGSDLAALCREAAMVPIRELGTAVAHVAADSVRKVEIGDFSVALSAVKPSVGRQQLSAYDEWTRQFGST